MPGSPAAFSARGTAGRARRVSLSPRNAAVSRPETAAVTPDQTRYHILDTMTWGSAWSGWGCKAAAFRCETRRAAAHAISCLGQRDAYPAGVAVILCWASVIPRWASVVPFLGVLCLIHPRIEPRDPATILQSKLQNLCMSPLTALRSSASRRCFGPTTLLLGSRKSPRKKESSVDGLSTHLLSGAARQVGATLAPGQASTMPAAFSTR